ncbi:MAG: DUF6797 domain-containing protein [Limisphaerales bacterium]
MNLRITILSLALVITVAAQDQGSLPAGTMLLPESALPAYEKEIDHQRLVKDQSRGVVRMGQEIYQMICHNCHGDLNFAGSIPLSLRFGEGQFQHGSDPYTMYQSITRGWRLMAPVPQLTPREKYAVIHYIRSHYLKPHNPSQLFKVTDRYLDTLPKGKSLGPNPVKREPWKDMDYGPWLIGTYEIATPEKRANPRPKGKQADYVAPGANIAQKAIGIRLDAGEGGVTKGKQWSAFEHDTLRVAGVWSGEGFIDYNGINFNGRHVARPRTVGEPLFETADAPGWANPMTGKFEDLRFVGVDGRRFGPLPRKWGRFKGIYRHGSKIVMSYSVGKTDILEHHAMQGYAFVRHLNIAKSKRDLTVRLANAGAHVAPKGPVAISIREADGFVTATIRADQTPVNLAFLIGVKVGGKMAVKPLDLKPLTKGGPAQYVEPVATVTIRGKQDGAFQWDSFSIPVLNPWKARMRPGGIDFTPDGKAMIVVCWDGDVYRVTGIADEAAVGTEWRRIATGMFQPLGVKFVGADIFVTCRDQIVRLVDLNGDGETDFYENFNSDHQVSEHFHEFAMGLQADEAGNLYYAKSARHARPQLVAHHGTLLKVSADGTKTEILANGFRAANGVCRNPDGSFFVTDQEGHWNPMNRINRVVPGDNFYGNMWSYGAPDDKSDSAMEPPLCWVDKQFDRSPAELLWIDSKNWGPLNGKLLNLSYGFGRLEIVPHENVNGVWQGGLCRLPIPDFATGTMRGRFHPRNGHLYICGLSVWATSTQTPGGFYRIRATGKPAHLPVGLHATKSGVEITYSDPLDRNSVKADKFEVRTWALKRSANYGSRHYDKRSHDVKSASLSKDRKTVRLRIADISPVWQMSIRYDVQGANGEPVKSEIQNTIHTLAE